MNAYAAVTDKNWFDHLRSLSRREQVDEVNFWTPKPWGGHFRVLTRGQPLLFKLKSPHNVIAGGGFFEHYTELPVGLAWQAFGEKNGAPSLDAVRRRTAHLRRDRPRSFEVSKHIHTDFDDGENYYKLHGKGLWVPPRAEHRPGRDYLEWHNQNRFRGVNVVAFNSGNAADVFS